MSLVQNIFMNMLGVAHKHAHSHVGRTQVDKDLAMFCGPVTGSVGRTIDRINKDLQSPSYMLYTLTTISVWFTDIHSNCQPAPPTLLPLPLLPPPAHIQTTVICFYGTCVCECVLVVLSRTCIRQLAVQFIQYINFNNM